MIFFKRVSRGIRSPASDCQKRSRRAAFFAIIEAVMKMLKKEAEQRQAIEMLCTDMLVPQDHLLRKIDAAVDFRHIYELVEDLYCEDNGRPSCDPVVLFKLVLIQHLFGTTITSICPRSMSRPTRQRSFLQSTSSARRPVRATTHGRKRSPRDRREPVYRQV